MPAYTRDQIRTSLDAHTATTLGTTPAIPFLYGNTENVGLSEGTTSYVKQRVIFTTDKQMDLGNRCSRRVRGYVNFLIHVRYDSGDLDRDLISERLAKAFRSQQIGGATMMDAQVVGSLRSEAWAITALNIPFYFESHT